MNVLVNGLSCTNLSGRQVLIGHLAELMRDRSLPHRFWVLLHDANRDIWPHLQSECGPMLNEKVQLIVAPERTAGWMGRKVYERFRLPGLVRKLRIDVLLSLSGMYTPGLACRQHTLALNPWPLLPALQKDLADRTKASLQRMAYRQAVKRADGIGFGSMYMKRLYREHAGCDPRKDAIVYPALGSASIHEMQRASIHGFSRDPLTIVCASLMAPHKNVEGLLRALHLMHTIHGMPARLRLVGGWADARYRHLIESMIREHGLESSVVLTGHLERDAYIRELASARVYALLSRSESFGIPSVEAQWMGTPVVAAHGCAAPEICGDGGVYVEAGDAEAAAAALCRLLSDQAYWQGMSDRAAVNARRFQYSITSSALKELLFPS